MGADCFRGCDMIDITPELLRELLRYEPETGKLFWRVRPSSMFKTVRTADAWNRLYAGKEALTADNGAGYRVGDIFGQTMRSHRVIWAIVYGEWPDNIDHINGVRDDNRWHNLRSVSRHGNMQNTARRADNKSGVTGVCWVKARGKWEVKIRVGGADKYIGLFASYTIAVAARKSAEIEYGFHPNHGRNAA